MIKISDIAKKAIDGFFAGNVAPDELGSKIFKAETASNAALRWLNKLNNMGSKGNRGRIVYILRRDNDGGKRDNHYCEKYKKQWILVTLILQ